METMNSELQSSQKQKKNPSSCVAFLRYLLVANEKFSTSPNFFLVVRCCFCHFFVVLVVVVVCRRLAFHSITSFCQIFFPLDFGELELLFRGDLVSDF